MLLLIVVSLVWPFSFGLISRFAASLDRPSVSAARTCAAGLPAIAPAARSFAAVRAVTRGHRRGAVRRDVPRLHRKLPVPPRLRSRTVHDHDADPGYSARGCP